MGSCFSKKNVSSSPSPPSQVAPPNARYAAATKAQVALADTRLKMLSLSAKQEPKLVEESNVKDEIFVIKHRKSHDERERQQQKAEDAPIAADNCKEEVVSVDENKKAKEEVEAILIQCGRLSRSSSGKAASSSNKYSGSKRSYDFDNNAENDYQVNATTSDDAFGKKNDDLSDERTRQHRQRHRQSPRHSPSPGRRRRTPSRERNQQNQRSGSRERRTSRSPGRRLSMEQNNPNSTNANTAATDAVAANISSDASGTTNKPGKMKMISVPAAVMDKSSNGESATAAGPIKRISVKRNAGAASPRSQSPARGGGNVKAASNDSSMPPSLSRSSSRKAEYSPYRRNPLSELDTNIANTNNKSSSNVLNQLKSNVEITTNKVITQGINNRSISPMERKVVVEPANMDGLKHPKSTRSRSARRSRDLDNINPETLSNPAPPSYTSLLLEDIHNFHQQGSTNAAPAAVSLPQCVSKAHSILEAVADLNSTTSCSMKSSGVKDVPFVESEVLVGDDLNAPSFHKYVTVRRGGGASDTEDQELSGSNSLVCSSQQLQWGGLSSSADSTDCWTSQSSTREADQLEKDRWTELGRVVAALDATALKSEG